MLVSIKIGYQHNYIIFFSFCHLWRMRRKLLLTTRIAFERYLWRSIFTLVFFIFLLLFGKFFIVDVGRVEGQSMEPMLVDNQLFFVNRFIYFFRAPKRFDVVQLIDPQRHQLMVKRIIGLPEETIIIKRGKVYIVTHFSRQEEELPEKYLSPVVATLLSGQTAPAVFAVPPHHYFVLGDNRFYSVDSRYFGTVDRSVILGKIR